jgi:hypothetical protein
VSQTKAARIDSREIRKENLRCQQISKCDSPGKGGDCPCKSWRFLLFSRLSRAAKPRLFPNPPVATGGFVAFWAICSFHHLGSGVIATRRAVFMVLSVSSTALAAAALSASIICTYLPITSAMR